MQNVDYYYEVIYQSLSCGGASDLQDGRFLEKTYPKTKELGPVGWAGGWR